MHEDATATAGLVDAAVLVAKDVLEPLDALGQHREQVRGCVVADAEVFFGDA